MELRENTPRFFKIIMDKTICEGKLGIPKKFARLYKNDLSSPVLLKVIDGSVWEIELAASDDGIWLQKGWQEFVKHYSLANGHFLVFEFHQRICQFNVIIFDITASEIDYPFSNSVNSHNELEEPEIEEIEIQTLDLERIIENIMRSKSKRKARLLHKASVKFKTKNPFFMVSIQPSHVSSEYKLAIRGKFAIKYLKKSRGNATLNVLDGRIWPVKYYICVYNTATKFKSQTIAKFTQGWRVFAKDNQLEVGDICAFEMIKRSEPSAFKVTIFRCNKSNKKQLLDGESSNPAA